MNEAGCSGTLWTAFVHFVLNGNNVGPNPEGAALTPRHPRSVDLEEEVAARCCGHFGRQIPVKLQSAVTLITLSAGLEMPHHQTATNPTGHSKKI
ncbi:MAG: hypothetical protein GY903_05930 [Fuerstiella sp.]|nr:hypothetical protein [Fuerstiella sp.]MCP4854013.1 hypothetical protein [Fuerstiella sp.]